MKSVVRWAAAVVGLAVLSTATGCDGGNLDASEQDTPSVALTDDTSGLVTLAFAGDVHFPGDLARLLDDPGSTLGAMSEQLTLADVAMVNLESAIVTGNPAPDPKELERADRRYWFSTSPAALDLLDRSGVDVVTVANNHGADRGAAGLRQTLRAARRAPVAVVGVGKDLDRALTPHRVTVRGTGFSFFGADASTREGANPVWAAGTGPGVADARADRPAALLEAVRRAGGRGDVVVVYLHWGTEYASCPDPRQLALAESLSRAGADIIVGTHTHTLQGAGMLGSTYVAFGLGNFHWYNAGQPLTGVLQVQVRDGKVVGDDWTAARVPDQGGQPAPLAGAREASAVASWRALRSCTGLAAPPGSDEDLTPYTATIDRVDGALLGRMRADQAPGCPVALSELRRVRVSYVDFDGISRHGNLIIHQALARDVVGVFRELYAARFPIERMRPVPAFGGSDAASMAANNTSGYNCRRVDGQAAWSDHAYGAAIDINPKQNPYLRPGSVQPAAGREFAALDRSQGARVPPGVVTRNDVVHRAFSRVGWEWGGDFSEPDFQHFRAR
ncbi:hypothetical protein ncot_18685 [Nocardioides sp. JQ2195]|uniref:CapA family protein n=1 Tax=Nocardioides sp. JQ2195 TaxID=2592334 RepID=UPI00143E3C61|nr:CapA family protein [Nocardioides sp. JQ2195]QIX28391.1 hypothetical protein ncot_18685 [Nocardioides sp. JQ2195]